MHTIVEMRTGPTGTRMRTACGLVQFVTNDAVEITPLDERKKWDACATCEALAAKHAKGKDRP
jgi:hypothetical protein